MCVCVYVCVCMERREKRESSGTQLRCERGDGRNIKKRKNGKTNGTSTMYLIKGGERGDGESVGDSGSGEGSS